MGAEQLIVGTLVHTFVTFNGKPADAAAAHAAANVE
jgi:hypothetical protein